MGNELWFTAILNKLFAAPVTALLTALAPVHYSFTFTGKLAWLSMFDFSFAWVRPTDPAHPIPNYIAMEVMVLLLLIVVALVVHRRLSVESPGKLQHVMELTVQFIRSMSEEIIGHKGLDYLAMIGTLGLFIAMCNLWGLVPSFSTPTARIEVTLGCAVAAFLYYNYHGVREQGALGYLRHLCGPMLAMAILMLPIEIISNLGRLLSLSVRLQANMLVGGQLDKVFAATLPHALEGLQGTFLHAIGAALGPVISIFGPPMFMGLHLFESFLQAYVFMLLPAVYISLAVTKEH